MNWNNAYSKTTCPSWDDISRFIDNGLWQELCGYLEVRYAVSPVTEYSVCSGAPGWNVKYKRGGRSLCTLYPAQGFFTCLVSIGGKEATEAELLLTACTDYVQNLYWKCKPFNGSRWLMIDVTSPEILRDVKELISTRAKPAKMANSQDVI